MRYSIYLQQSKNQKFPTTYAYRLLEGDLLVFLRPWGSQDYNQKFLDEISHYLSSALADVDVTSPFDFEDHLTTLTNKLKIALLIAHDFFYKVENRTTYSVGFEAALLFRSKNEVAWACVGRFDLYEVTNQHMRSITITGSDLDVHQNVLLPLDLLGLEKNFSLRCGSLQIKPDVKLMAVSIYGPSNILPNSFAQNSNASFTDLNDLTSLWSAQIELE